MYDITIMSTPIHTVCPGINQGNQTLNVGLEHSPEQFFAIIHTPHAVNIKNTLVFALDKTFYDILRNRRKRVNNH